MQTIAIGYISCNLVLPIFHLNDESIWSIDGQDPISRPDSSHPNDYLTVSFLLHSKNITPVIERKVALVQMGM